MPRKQIPWSQIPWSQAGRWAGFLAQLVVLGLGLDFVLYADEASSLPTLLLWCLVTGLYSLAVIVSLARRAFRDQRREASPMLSGSLLVRAVSVLQAQLSSLVGLFAALLVMLAQKGPDEVAFKAVGVVAMILSWGLMHWGFAQVYASYSLRSGPLFRFAGTETPGMVEFVYLAFTVGTTFAVSDVESLSSRARWLLLTHSVLSFFYNGLIIVFALNIIQSAAG